MKKEVKIGILVSVLLLAAFLIMTSLKYLADRETYIIEVDRKLAPEHVKIYEDKLAQAETLLANAQSDEERHEIYIFIGHQKYGLGKLAEAEEAYYKSIEYKDDDYVSYTALYQVYLEMNNNKAAQKAIKKAIELRPDVADNWLKYIILEQERFSASNEEINQIYQDALKGTEYNTDFDVMTSYAQFLENTGDLRGAIEYWQKAMGRNPTKTEEYNIEIKRLEALIGNQN